MAQIANVNEPVTISALEVVQPLPIGPLLDVGTITSVTGYTTTVSNRFPVPPSAAAFLTDVDTQMVPSQQQVSTIIYGALSVAGPYLEPNIGQIWPRAG